MLVQFAKLIPCECRTFPLFLGTHATRERHIHRVADMVFVFDLSLRERRLLGDAPHDRLRAAIQQSARDEFEDFPRDLRFGRIAHRRVGMIPIADDAEPLEFLPLHAEPMFGIGAAFLAEGDDGLRIREVGLHLALGSVEFFLDLPFDRQPVAVPAGHIVGFAAGHLVRPDDDVLQRLVERGADVDIAVGVRRPVVEHEFWAALAALAQLCVQVLARPTRQNFRLLLRQARAHGKVGLWQIEGARIIESGDRRVGHETRAKFGCFERTRPIRGFGAVRQIRSRRPANLS